MRLVLLVTLIAAALGNPFMDFHAQYVERFVKTEHAASFGAPNSCAKYECSSASMPDDQCVKYDSNSNTYLLQPCKGNTFCGWALYNHGNSMCYPNQESIYSGLPGQKCDGNDQCMGRAICQNGICVGRSAGAFCDDQDDCAIGTLCHNLPDKTQARCEPQKTLGQTCGNYLNMELCENNLTCNMGYCNSTFSKSEGDIVDATTAAYLCDTGFFEYQNDTSKAKCVAAPKSQAVSQPIECQPGSSCMSADGMYTTPCECGYNYYGKSYCPLFPGDYLYQQFFSQVMSYMQNPKINQCHFLNIGQEACNTIDEDVYKRMFQTKLEVDYFVKKLGNDDCVKEIYTAPFWESIYLN